MGRPAIQIFKLTDNLTVYECHPDEERRYPHWRVYDTQAGYNIVMGARTKEAALVEAIGYWSDKHRKKENEHADLKKKVDAFLTQFPANDDED